MDFSKLTQNNQIVAGGTVVTLISGLLPWFSFSFGSGPQSGFGSGLFGLFGILLVVAGGSLLLMKVLDVQDVKIQDLSAEQLAMVVAALGVLFILLRVLFKGSDPLGISDVSRSWGMWVGLLAAIATLAGIFLSSKDAGVGIPTADNFKSEGSGGGDTPSGGTSTF